jgi:hypothetical protein
MLRVRRKPDFKESRQRKLIKMQNFKFKKLGLLSLFCSLFFSYCKAQGEPEFINKLIATSPLKDNALKDGVTSKFFNPSIVDNFVTTTSGINFDIHNMTISQYENTNAQVISVPEIPSSQNNLDKQSLQIIVKNGIVTNEALIITLRQGTKGQYECTYNDIRLQKFATTVVVGGKLIDAKTYSFTPKNNGERGFWRCWGECLSVGFNSFVNGNPINAGFGLACWAFGGACAAGAGLGCAGYCALN